MWVDRSVGRNKGQVITINNAFSLLIKTRESFFLFPFCFFAVVYRIVRWL